MVFVDVEMINLPLLSMGKTDVLFVCGVNRILLIQHQIFDHFGVPFWFCGVKNLLHFCFFLGFQTVFVDVETVNLPLLSMGRRTDCLFVE